MSEMRSFTLLLQLGRDTEEQRHVPLCLDSVEEEENLHLWTPLLGDFT